MPDDQPVLSPRPYAGRGRVLRVKEGYNPNSSSLGSVVFVIPVALFGVPVLLASVASLIESHYAARDAKAARTVRRTPARPPAGPAPTKETVA